MTTPARPDKLPFNVRKALQQHYYNPDCNLQREFRNLCACLDIDKIYRFPSPSLSMNIEWDPILTNFEPLYGQKERIFEDVCKAMELLLRNLVAQLHVPPKPVSDNRFRQRFFAAQIRDIKVRPVTSDQVDVFVQNHSIVMELPIRNAYQFQCKNLEQIRAGVLYDMFESPIRNIGHEGQLKICGP